DVVAGGFDVTFNNSWVGVKRGAVAFPVLPESWRIYTPNVPGNIYKNFVFHKGGHERAVLFEQNLLLPSVMYRINRRSTVAFVCRMRQTGNISGVSPALANLFANEFDLGVLQNNPVQNRNFNAIRMTWMSYGFSYARVLAEKKRHRLSAGATLQLL